jgi:hypothetical protein
MKNKVDFLDVNMLAPDMGVESVPPEHPEALDFLPRQLQSQKVFDLVICDGQVLRTHERAAHRETREATRLTLEQLARSLEPDVNDVLDDFGPRLVELGRSVWETQVDALAVAPFNPD